MIKGNSSGCLAIASESWGLRCSSLVGALGFGTRCNERCTNEVSSLPALPIDFQTIFSMAGCQRADITPGFKTRDSESSYYISAGLLTTRTVCQSSW
jgi:hypothetical protein